MTITQVDPALLIPSYAETAANFLSMLRWMEQTIRADWGNIHAVQSAMGEHTVTYTEADDSEEPEEGDYATIGFVFPLGFYAEIEDNTYGLLQGIRIYRSEDN